MTMEEKLRDNYTLYLSRDVNGEKGCYLRKIERGMEPASLNGDEFLVLSKFPLINEALKNGKLLQMYQGDLSHMFTVMMGNSTYEGPYAEVECLGNTIVAYANSPILALMELDSLIENTKEDEKISQKAYRLYGSDKYQFYTK